MYKIYIKKVAVFVINEKNNLIFGQNCSHIFFYFYSVYQYCYNQVKWHFHLQAFGELEIRRIIIYL